MQRLVLCLLTALILPMAQARSGEEDFVSLFDGKTLSGWTGECMNHFTIDSGTLVTKAGCQGKLLTEREYSDFVLRFDFKLTPGANNGLAIRTPKPGDSAYVGLELQILDNTADMYKNLQPYQYHGSAYGIAPAKRGALKPVGEWNSQEVRCEGRHIHVRLNGEVILDVNLDEAAPNHKTIDGKEHPGLTREKGHIGFLCHGSVVSFRNIHLRDLSENSGGSITPAKPN